MKIDRLHTPKRNQFPIKRTALILVRGAKDKGEVTEEDLDKAYRLGETI